MPDKPLTIATYAAGAGLAAITLVYVFGPTFLMDDEAATTSKSSRKKGVVGLYNPANDCFINSVLQTLAGLPELRVYLIRELHRRRLDGKEIYSLVEQDDKEIRPNEGKDIVERVEVHEPDWKVLGLQQGIVTAGLKQMLDALNERPIYKKTISASAFVHVLEQAFRTRISRQQQDAQEFLQIVTERLSDEYYAGRSARRKARSTKSYATLREAARGIDTAKPTSSSSTSSHPLEIEQIHDGGLVVNEPDVDAEEDASFPFQGKIESQIECTHCHFKPKPSASSFVTLTLNVPTTSTSTSLNSCFDGMFKIEHIDDFKCEYCRLQHALDLRKASLAKSSTSPEQKTLLEQEIASISHALANDPESTPKAVTLPPPAQSPKRRIARHMRISEFPRVLAIHLSRSVWDQSSSSSKNLAKVSFPETLPLGGLLEQKQYRLLGVVTHKGGHNSGHYESFRRQFLAEPFSAHVSMGKQGVFSNTARTKSTAGSGLSSPGSLLTPTTPTGQSSNAGVAAAGAGAGAGGRDGSFLHPHRGGSDSPSLSSSTSTPAHSSSGGSISSDPQQQQQQNQNQHQHLQYLQPEHQNHAPTESNDSEDQPRRNKSVASRMHDKVSDSARSLDLARQRRRTRRENSRWWRISDEKIKECSTRDVLGMQREVYLLFYEFVG